MKKTLLVFVCAAVGFGLIACEKAAPTTPQSTAKPQTEASASVAPTEVSTSAASPVVEEGYPKRFNGTGSVYNGVELEPTGEYIELESSERGTLFMNGVPYPFSWELNGTDFTMKQDVGIQYQGQLAGEELILDVSTIMYHFSSAAGSENPVLSPTVETDPVETTAAPAADSTVWARDWYGWWHITNAVEGYEELDDYWWDTCASVTEIETDFYEMDIWDEEGSDTELLAYVEFDVSDNIATSTFGQFYEQSLGGGEWTIDPAGAPYPDTLIIQSHYTDDEGAFDYQIYLRPWGDLWEEVALSSPEDLPYYFETWYIPLVENGSEMPNVMDLPVEEDTAD